MHLPKGALKVGDVVTFNDDPRRWRVREVGTFDGSIISIRVHPIGDTELEVLSSIALEADGDRILGITEGEEKG